MFYLSKTTISEISQFRFLTDFRLRNGTSLAPEPTPKPLKVSTRNAIETNIDFKSKNHPKIIPK